MAARISVDTDTWWHLRSGQWIVENQRLPYTDPFSYTRAGQSWEYPGWLVQIPMYVVFRIAGPGGLNLLTALLVTLAYFFIWRTLNGGVFLKAIAVVMAAAASGVYWAARPYMLTFVLSAIFIWILENERQKNAISFRGGIFWLPLLMVIWANGHGGFAVGFLIWGVYWSSMLIQWGLNQYTNRQTENEGNGFEQTSHLKRMTWIGALMIVGVCLNPYGPQMLLYPFKTVSIGALKDYIQEWQSPNFHNIQVQPFAWLLLALLGVVGAARRRMLFTDFALAAGFAYMGLLAGRNIALFGLVAPMVITRHAAPLSVALTRKMGLPELFQGAVTPRSARLNVLLLMVILLAVVAKLSLIYPEQANREVFETQLPVGAVAYLRENLPNGRLFNSYNWGGYLLWALPEYPVFIDGRTDLYNDAVITTWLKVMRAENGWVEILNEWDVNLILVEPDTPLVGALKPEGWSILYADDQSVLFGR